MCVFFFWGGVGIALRWFGKVGYSGIVFCLFNEVGVRVGFRTGLGWLKVSGWSRVGFGIVYCWFRVGLFRAFFEDWLRFGFRLVVGWFLWRFMVGFPVSGCFRAGRGPETWVYGGLWIHRSTFGGLGLPSTAL